MAVCLYRGVVVKEKGKSFCRVACVESESIQVVWEFLKSEEVVFNRFFQWSLFICSLVCRI